MKGKIAAAIISVIALVAAIIAAVFVNYYTNSDKVISFDAESDGETLAFTCENMYPGQVQASEFRLESVFDGEIIFKFVEGDVKALLPYLNAEVSVDGVSLYSGSLNELMGKNLTSRITQEGSDFALSYWIDIDADNSAQGLSAKFYVDLKVER